MEERLQALKDMFSQMTNDFSLFGIITEIVDIVISVALIIIILRMFRLKIKQRKVILYILLGVVLFVVAYFLNFTILQFLIKYVGFWIFGLIIIVYNQEIRHMFDNTIHEGLTNNRNFTTEEEKKQVIDTLIDTAKYLSERKIGALITIEGRDNLDSIIDKSIKINSDISLDILSTIFYVGTVTHDGAVIIRKNKIMCAGAFLPSTDRYDIPKELGSRHRAAIGLSEKYDALTIIVSEETGNISITLNNGIDIAIEEKQLREKLEQFLVVNKQER